MKAKHEKLTPIERPAAQTEQFKAGNAKLDQPALEKLFHQRRKQIELLKPYLSLKFFYSLLEKIGREQDSLERLLNLEQQKQDILSQYSFVLDPNYFEQRFFNS